MAMPTLLDIAKQNGNDAVVGLIDEASKAHPEILLGTARTIKGLNYKTLVRSAVPTVAFRNANEGTAVVKGTYENRLVETYTLNPPWECDKAVADRHEDGAAAYIATEGAAVMEGALQAVCKQFYYGPTLADAKGFPGLIDSVHSDMVVDATGSSAGTGSSVWAVSFGPQKVQWVWGQNGELALSDPIVVRLLDTADNPYLAYHQEILAYPGLQVGNLQALGRIKNITADSGKSLTDTLLASLLGKFPVGWAPDLFLMNRRSVGQLRASRTATNATGTPAPFPTEAFGVPIAVTDAILSTETIV